ncbi:MAG: hypothetical protein ACK5UI_07120, partial [Bacteroidota bacterium]
MKQIIKYFFYRLYSISLSNGEHDAGWSMTIVSLFSLANIYSFFDLILIVSNSQLPQVNNIFIILISGVILYFNYYLLIKDGKALDIVKEFNDEDKSKRLLKTILIWAYMITSVVLFVYTGKVVR